MNKTWLILRHELYTAVTRRSFLLTLVLLPLVSFVVIMVVSLIQRSETAGTQPEAGGSEVSLTEGIVDQSGLILTIPDDLATRLKRYPDEAAAASALQAEEIKSYFIVPADYLETGSIQYVRPDFNPMDGFDQAGVVQSLLNYNLLAGEPDIRARIQNPVNLEVEYLTTEEQRDPESALTFFVPYGVTFLFYIVILSSASLLLNNIASEKQNRMLEILMTSITPVQMLTGKIIALGITGLLQTVVWSVAGLLLLRLSGRTLQLPAAFQLPANIIVWGVVFFLLGYALYASLMAGVGALVPNLREASQATFVVILPLIIPLVMISNLINAPDGGLALFLSLFPLTSPVSMMTRIAATSVPVWQILLASFLLALTAALAVRAVAGMFRAQTLLSGEPFRMGRFFRALAGR